MASLYEDLNTDEPAPEASEQSKPAETGEYDPASTSGAGQDEKKEEKSDNEAKVPEASDTTTTTAAEGAPKVDGDAPATSEDDKPVSIFVGGLAWSTTEAGLKMYFEEFGPVTHIDFKRGFAFVHFANKQAADACIKDGAEHLIDGKMVEIKLSDPHNPAKQQPMRVGGGGYAPSTGGGGSSSSSSAPQTSSVTAPTSTGPSSQLDQDPGRKVFVGGLPQEVREPELRQHMEQHGKVDDVVVMIDRVTQRSRGFGYVTYATAADAQLASKQRRQMIQNKLCEVKLYEPSARPVPGSGGGGPHTSRGPGGYAHGQSNDWNRHRPFNSGAPTTGSDMRRPPREYGGGGGGSYGHQQQQSHHQHQPPHHAPQQNPAASSTGAYHVPPYAQQQQQQPNPYAAYYAGYYGGGAAAPSTMPAAAQNPYTAAYGAVPGQAGSSGQPQQQWGQYDYSAAAAWSAYGAAAPYYGAGQPQQPQQQSYGGYPGQQQVPRGQERR